MGLQTRSANIFAHFDDDGWRGRQNMPENVRSAGFTPHFSDGLRRRLSGKYVAYSRNWCES
jgi:hypothetical protein